MIMNYKGFVPDVNGAAFVAENAAVIGRVQMGQGSSVWFGAVLRGDDEKIAVGKNSNIQDNCTVHCTSGFPTVIGDNVSVGHNAVLHGCTIGNGSLIGMSATVMNGAVIGFADKAFGKKRKHMICTSAFFPPLYTDLLCNSAY